MNQIRQCPSTDSRRGSASLEMALSMALSTSIFIVLFWAARWMTFALQQAVGTLCGWPLM